MIWASNSADDPTFDHLIEQAELDALWEATTPDEPDNSISSFRRDPRYRPTPREETPPPEASER